MAFPSFKYITCIVCSRYCNIIHVHQYINLNHNSVSSFNLQLPVILTMCMRIPHCVWQANRTIVQLQQRKSTTVQHHCNLFITLGCIHICYTSINFKLLALLVNYFTQLVKNHTYIYSSSLRMHSVYSIYVINLIAPAVTSADHSCTDP